MNEGELLQWARDLRTRWDGRWKVDERPIGAYEMYALSELSKQERRERRDSEGCCCDEGPMDTGGCRHLAGECPIWREARKLERKIFEEV